MHKNFQIWEKHWLTNRKRLNKLQIVRTVTDLKLQYFDHLMWLFEKDPDAGKDWGQKEKEVRESEMVGWHHQLNGHEFEQAPGDSEGEGSLERCSPWGYK